MTEFPVIFLYSWWQKPKISPVLCLVAKQLILCSTLISQGNVTAYFWALQLKIIKVYLHSLSDRQVWLQLLPKKKRNVHFSLFINTMVNILIIYISMTDFVVWVFRDSPHCTWRCGHQSVWEILVLVSKPISSAKSAKKN